MKEIYEETCEIKEDNTEVENSATIDAPDKAVIEENEDNLNKKTKHADDDMIEYEDEEIKELLDEEDVTDDAGIKKLEELGEMFGQGIIEKTAEFFDEETKKETEQLNIKVEEIIETIIIKYLMDDSLEDYYDFNGSPFMELGTEGVEEELNKLIDIIRCKRKLCDKQIQESAKRIQKFNPILSDDFSDTIITSQINFGDAFKDSNYTESIEMCDFEISTCLKLIADHLDSSVSEELLGLVDEIQVSELVLFRVCCHREWLKKLFRINRQTLIGCTVDHLKSVRFFLLYFIDTKNKNGDEAYMTAIKRSEDGECDFFDEESKEITKAYYESIGEDANEGIQTTEQHISDLLMTVYDSYVYIMSQQFDISRRLQSRITPAPLNADLLDTLAEETVNKYIENSEWHEKLESKKQSLDEMLITLEKVLPDLSRNMRILCFDFINDRELRAFESNKAELCEQWKKLQSQGRVFSPQYMSKSGKNKKKSSKKKSKR